VTYEYDAAAGFKALALADAHHNVLAVNRLMQPTIDGMRADLWLKHRNTEVFNPVTKKKEA